MWQLIWNIAPDVIAVIMLTVKLSRILGLTNKKFAESIVKQIIEKFNIRSVNVSTKSGAIDLVSNLMDLEQLRDAIVTASLISLAGTLALVSDPSFEVKGKLLCIFWFVLFVITRLTNNTDTEDKRVYNRKKILWCTMFFLYILLSILAKTVTFKFF